ncbi:MAG: DUF4924 family protein [Marinilabiliaceae bacterium]|nr:DUF4924 family protein [Marinilabiliaceae bacterium]
MIIAQAKKKENIIEYMLYMWQVEDLIRANNLDMQKIDQNIITQYHDQPADLLLEIRDWWENLVEMMRLEKKEQSGHLQINLNTVNDLHQLHMTLMKDVREAAYRNQYYQTAPFIIEFERKMGQTPGNEIDTCLTAIYSSFLLKLQGKEISSGTREAVRSISRLMALLAKKYPLWQAGKIGDENDNEQ